MVFTRTRPTWPRGGVRVSSPESRLARASFFFFHRSLTLSLPAPGVTGKGSVCSSWRRCFCGKRAQVDCVSGVAAAGEAALTSRLRSFVCFGKAAPTRARNLRNAIGAADQSIFGVSRCHFRFFSPTALMTLTRFLFTAQTEQGDDKTTLNEPVGIFMQS